MNCLDKEKPLKKIPTIFSQIVIKNPIIMDSGKRQNMPTFVAQCTSAYIEISATSRFFDILLMALPRIPMNKKMIILKEIRALSLIFKCLLIGMLSF